MQAAYPIVLAVMRQRPPGDASNGAKRILMRKDSVMGFLFRLCFWLGVTLAIMPPDERPGETLAGTPNGGTIEERFTATVEQAWSLVSQVSTACEQNPALCAATAALVQTTAETGQSLVEEVQAPRAAVPPPAAAPAAPAAEPQPDPSSDGRVGLGEGPGA
jgi:hypothetical protein